MDNCVAYKKLPPHCINHNIHSSEIDPRRPKGIVRGLLAIATNIGDHVRLSDALMDVLLNGNPSNDKLDKELVDAFCPVWKGTSLYKHSVKEDEKFRNITIDDQYSEVLNCRTFNLKLKKCTYVGFREACVEVVQSAKSYYEQLQTQKRESAINDGKKQARLGRKNIIKRERKINEKIRKEKKKMEKVADVTTKQYHKDRMIRFSHELTYYCKCAKADGTMEAFLNAYDAEKQLMEQEKKAEEKKADDTAEEELPDSWEDIEC